MSNYNSGYIYNADGNENGIFYNMDTYIILINLREVLNVSDSFPKVIASYVLRDRISNMRDAVIQTAFYGKDEYLKFNDAVRYSALFSVTDAVGITDEISALLVYAALYDKTEIIDEVKQFNKLLIQEQFDATDDINIQTLFELLEKFNLKDLQDYLDIFINTHDHFGLTDGTPKSAISDFIIGSYGDYDTAYDWFIPFNMKVDWNATSIQVMPPAESTTIEMPGIDGSIIENTVYKDRLFQIVAFSEEGLSKEQKEELKSKITEILDSTKHQSKKLTVQASGNSFDVKYDGQANITEGPSYVKATIPLTTSPYGYKAFEGELDGSGLVNNEGDAPVGAKHTIYGPVVNPSFTFGTITYQWTGSVPFGYRLVIDHQMMTCYLQDSFGVKTNAMSGLTGTFQKIPAHASIALTSTGVPESQIITTWRDSVLW